MPIKQVDTLPAVPLTQYDKDVLEFIESGWDFAEIFGHEALEIPTVMQRYITAISKQYVTNKISVRSRNGKIYLIRRKAYDDSNHRF